MHHRFPESPQSQLLTDRERAAAASAVSGAMWGSIEANIHCFRELYMGRVSLKIYRARLKGFRQVC